MILHQNKKLFNLENVDNISDENKIIDISQISGLSYIISYSENLLFPSNILSSTNLKIQDLQCDTIRSSFMYLPYNTIGIISGDPITIKNKYVTVNNSIYFSSFLFNYNNLLTYSNNTLFVNNLLTNDLHIQSPIDFNGSTCMTILSDYVSSDSIISNTINTSRINNNQTNSNNIVSDNIYSFFLTASKLNINQFNITDGMSEHISCINLNTSDLHVTSNVLFNNITLNSLNLTNISTINITTNSCNITSCNNISITSTSLSSSNIISNITSTNIVTDNIKLHTIISDNIVMRSNIINLFTSKLPKVITNDLQSDNITINNDLHYYKSTKIINNISPYIYLGIMNNYQLTPIIDNYNISNSQTSLYLSIPGYYLIKTTNITNINNDVCYYIYPFRVIYPIELTFGVFKYTKITLQIL